MHLRLLYLHIYIECHFLVSILSPINLSVILTYFPLQETDLIHYCGFFPVCFCLSFLFLLFLGETVFFHRIAWKAFYRPMQGDGCVARFIQLIREIEGFTWVSSLPSLTVPPWKKSSLVFMKTKTKASVQRFVSY